MNDEMLPYYKPKTPPPSYDSEFNNENYLKILHSTYMITFGILLFVYITLLIVNFKNDLVLF